MENRLPQIRQGDHVIYKNSGVCTVKEIALRAFGSLPPKEYYVLTRAADGADVYVPVAAGETLLTALHGRTDPCADRRRGADRRSAARKQQTAHQRVRQGAGVGGDVRRAPGVRGGL